MGTLSKLGLLPFRGEYLNYYNRKGQRISDAEGQHSDSDNFINPTGRNRFVALHTKAYRYYKVYNTAALICLIKYAFMELKISNNST